MKAHTYSKLQPFDIYFLLKTLNLNFSHVSKMTYISLGHLFHSLSFFLRLYVNKVYKNSKRRKIFKVILLLQKNENLTILIIHFHGGQKIIDCFYEQSYIVSEIQLLHK